MPSALMLTEDALPKYNEAESDEQRIKDIYNYLFMLVEQLRYSLANLGASNFNDTALGLIGEGITEELDGEVELITKALVGETGSIAQIIASGDALFARITDAEEKAVEAIATVDGLQFKVTNGDESSTLQLFSGNTVLTSANIQITGMVTFSDLTTPGSTRINGGNITTGTISAIDISACDIYGSNIRGSNITLYYDDDEYSDTSITFNWAGLPVGELEMYTNLGEEDSGNTQVGIKLSSTRYAALKLESGAGMSLEADTLIYMYADDYITVRSGDVINIEGDTVNIQNPVLIEVEHKNGATQYHKWTFTSEGIFRNGILRIPI